MGIEKSDFPELEGMETDDEETSEEETELRREEREAEDDWWFSISSHRPNRLPEKIIQILE
jgi:hypothetical protein